MKVLHLIESGGGSTEFIYLLAKYTNSVEHVVICGERAWNDMNALKKERALTFPINVQLINWPYAQREIKPLQDVKALLFLSKWMKAHRGKFDVVHCHSSKAGILGRLASQWLGYRNVIYTTHAVSFLRQDVSPLKHFLFVSIERLMALCNCTVVANSDSEQKELLKNGIDAIAIPNGTETVLSDGAHTSKTSARTSPLKVVTTGRITIQKNPVLFQEIAAHFSSEENVQFVWVGDGELRDILQSQNILVTGWVSKEEVKNILFTSDIYLSTALWEGMPLAVLEAMAVGKPLVLSDCVGNIDLVVPEYNGTVFRDSKEAITYLRELINDKEKRQRYGSNSLQLSLSTYNAGKVAETYCLLYQKQINT